jgi:Flp pilus assembly protein TadD
VARLQGRGRVPEALEAARRLAGLLERDGAGGDLRRRVEARVADLALLDRLEDARLEMSAHKYGRFDEEGADRRYGEAFRAAGLDVEALPAAEAGERLRGMTVAAELAAALDHWALVRRTLRGQEDASWKHLLAVARGADPEEGRQRLRQHLQQALERDQAQALADLAASEKVSRLWPATLGVLAAALRQTGRAAQAEALLREAQRRHPDDFWLNEDLGKVLWEQKTPAEAARFLTAAVALRPDSSGAHNNLGNALRDKGDVDGTIREYRRAIDLAPKGALAHNNLGVALDDKGDVDGAIKEYRLAIDCGPEFAQAHYNLGIALLAQGDVDGAIKEYRLAIDCDPTFPDVHSNLGLALRKRDDFAASLAELRRGHELGSKRPGWPDPSGQRVKNGERLLAADRKLPAVLKGEARPADPAEAAALANLCVRYKKLPAAAARLYAEAFDADPKLADDLRAGDRYNAACAAALAGCGQGKDAAGLGEEECGQLRLMARSWLRADLAAQRRLLEQAPDKARPAVAQQLAHWLQDSDLAGVHGAEALARLPEAERKDWRQLWEEVEALRRRAAEPSAAAGAARP